MPLPSEVQNLLDSFIGSVWQIDRIESSRTCVFCCSNPTHTRATYLVVAVYTKTGMISIVAYKVRAVHNLDGIYEELKKEIVQGIMTKLGVTKRIDTDM